MTKYYVTVLCLLIVVFLAVCYFRLTPAGEATRTRLVKGAQKFLQKPVRPYREIHTMGVYDYADAAGRRGEGAELMPLIQKDDSLEVMGEKMSHIYRAMAKDYERHLIRKYARLNPTWEEISEWRWELESITPKTPETRQELIELQDFKRVWVHIVNPPPPLPSYMETLSVSSTARTPLRKPDVSAVPASEDFTETHNWDIYIRFDHIRSVVMRVQRGDVVSEEEIAAAKFNDGHIELLNHLIVTRKIPAGDPGYSFTNIRQLSDEDKAFIEEAVKGNPAVKLPWRDVKHFERLERERQKGLLGQEIL